MKYAIIGAGISGLSIANLLKTDKDNEIIVFETDSRPGGMIKCDRVQGHLFHRTGGHVFNTKRKDVQDWFWTFFDREKEFIKADRNAIVSMNNGQIIPYPIENHAYQLEDNLLNSFIKDLLAMACKNKKQVTNFEDFLKQRFGETLYHEYFQPYNEKIWRKPLTDVPLSWLDGKLPMPTLEEIIYNNFKHVEEKQFVHSTFYYEKNGGSQFIANRLAERLNIRYNVGVNKIEKTKVGWIINGEEYNRVIFCGNLKTLPAILYGIDIEAYRDNIDALEAHGTTTVLCEIEDNPYSWIYMPSRNHSSHRIICTGNFAKSNRANGNMSATVEFTDYIDQNIILDNLKHIPFSPHYLTHHYEKYTYPIQNKDTRNNIADLKNFVEKSGLYLLGRFAEWEYYNMDVAMGAALDLFNNKLKR